MRNLIFLVLAIVVSSSISGCASNYLLTEPRVFKACLTDDSGDRELSFDILADILRRQKGWIVERISKENYEMDVRACRGSFCIPLLVTVDPDGEILWRRDPSITISDDWADLLKSWLNRIEEGYSRRRCARVLRE